jgi:mRNA interferase MazF
MRRGEIVVVDLGAARGSEEASRRPAIVVSSEGANRAAFNRGRGVVTVVPLTTNTARIYSFQLALPASESGLGQDSKVQVEQVRAIDVSRISRSVGQLPTALVTELDDRLRLHLAL